MSDASPDQSAVRAAEQEAFKDLDSISLKDILDQDSRPTFVLDLDSDYVNYGCNKELRPIFSNSALRLHETLLDSVTGPTEFLQESHEFRSWATSSSKFDDSRDVFPLACLYQGLIWTGSTIRQRFRIISGNRCYDISQLPKGNLLEGSPSELGVGDKSSSKVAIKTTSSASPASLRNPRASTFSGGEEGSGTLVTSQRSQLSRERSGMVSTLGEKSNDTSGSSNSIALSSPEHGCPDWTASKPAGFISEHIEFARGIDWASTPLGPMKSWSSQFREIANLVMRNPYPCALFWGEELTMLYNEAYAVEVAGRKHPELMGTGFSGPFAEMWDNVGPFFRECARTGKSVRRDNDPLPIERYGYLEETFFSWSFVPLYGGTARMQGFYNAPFERTHQTISSRRLQTLRDLGESLAQARTMKEYWKCVLKGLEENHYDVPFALLYSINDSDDSDTVSHSSESTISLKSCLLEGSIGIPEGHPASPPKLDLKRSKEGFIPAFREAMRTREPTMLHTRDGSLPEGLLEGIKWRGLGDPCKEAIIFPVRPTNGETIFAFLLIGVNPRRAYDEDYRDFSAMLNRQLATSLASFLLFEDEIRLNRNAAEAAVLKHEHLSHELELQTSRMRRMTELSPLGMYLFSPEGVLLEANDRYYEMTGHPRNNQGQFTFMNCVADGSREAVRGNWAVMKLDLKPSALEIQLNNPAIKSRDLNGEIIDYWVLSSSMPEVGEDGQLKSIMGSITDISHMKWAQGLQERRLREAEETKRQQNEFIDITSHEMRNPLSAVLIEGLGIRDTLTRHQFTASDAAVVDECVESANNIALCVQHMKSIVDDILTVSKLDSNLLLITPVPAQPVTVIQRAMSMFRPEVQAKDIEFNFCPHSSLQKLNVDWVNLDPVRLLQITVNLITNAIKFTQSSAKRVISVHVGASDDQIDLQSKGFEYVPTRGRSSITTGEDWGDGELLYLRVQVQDTGVGLTAEEKQLLFTRFTQASPRTHAYYGGNGLGLFISRQLAELHGGQIGVSSEAGHGSTFGFFIQTRRVINPNKTPPHSYLQLTAPVASGENPDPPHEPTTATKPLHVLIVEDNLVNQKVLARQLQKAGIVISTADNGLHALTHLATTEFQKPGGTPLSIILMDLEMPEMDGLTCVARIREMEKEGVVKGHVPVIAVTANVRGEQIATARDSGMDDVVSKPFRIHELMDKMNELLLRLGDR